MLAHQPLAKELPQLLPPKNFVLVMSHFGQKGAQRLNLKVEITAWQHKLQEEDDPG